jgi:carboxypeptidase Q
VGWTDEEKGGTGARAYHKAHQHEKHFFAMESDSGAFQPWGIFFYGKKETKRKLELLGKSYLAEIGAGNVTSLSSFSC